MAWWLPYCIYISFACIAWYLHYRGIDCNNLLILICFYGIDIVTGIAKVYSLWDAWTKNYYPDGRVMNDRFSTNRLIKGLTDKFIGLLVPFLVMWIGTIAGYKENIPFDVVVALSAGAEFISIMQNIYIARTGEKITEFDAWSFMMKFIVKQSAVIFRSALEYAVWGVIKSLKKWWGSQDQGEPAMDKFQEKDKIEKWE